MRWLIAAVAVACCDVALADELDNANRDVRTLTAEGARSWNAGRVQKDKPSLISVLAEQRGENNELLVTPEQRGYREVIVVLAEAVEPLAFSALSTRNCVVYRNLKHLDAMHEKYLDKDVYRPSLPAIESMTPELAKRLSGCKEWSEYRKTPLHLCGLKRVDGASLRHLKDLPLCLCGLEEIRHDAAEGLVSLRNTDNEGVLLSNITKVPDDAWRVIERRAVMNNPAFDAATLFDVTPRVRVIEGRCRHRGILFATEDEHRAKQPQPPQRQPSPNPFNR